MCLDDSWLLAGRCLLLGFSELFDESHGALLEAALESSAGAGMNKFHELLG